MGFCASLLSCYRLLDLKCRNTLLPVQKMNNSINWKRKLKEYKLIQWNDSRVKLTANHSIFFFRIEVYFLLTCTWNYIDCVLGYGTVKTFLHAQQYCDWIDPVYTLEDCGCCWCGADGWLPLQTRCWLKNQHVKQQQPKFSSVLSQVGWKKKKRVARGQQQNAPCAWQVGKAHVGQRTYPEHRRGFGEQLYLYSLPL